MSLAAARQGPYPIQESIESFESGGTSVTVEEFAPATEAGVPALLVLHGADGVQYRGSSYRSFARDLARNGYRALFIHYFERTRTSYGSPATIASNFLLWMQTIGDALTHAASNSRVDAERLGIIGFSLGGFLGLSVAAHDPRVKAVAEFFGGLPDLFAGNLQQMPPVLILHGDADHLVPVSEAHQLEHFLQEAQRPYEIHIYPGAGHNFSGADARDAMQRLLAFLQRHL